TGLVAVIGSFVVQAAARSTDEATGPSLIDVQDLFASVAEANTAATAAHLSVEVTGKEDRISRNLYTDALQRSNEFLTRVSADIGQGPTAQSQLQDIGAALASYSGEVEAARLAKLNGLPEADQRLRSAVDIVNSEIGPAVNAITTLGQAQYDDEAGEGVILIGVALALGLITLAALIVLQVRLAHRIRRVLSPLLVLSTVALLGLIGLLLYGNGLRMLALDDAETGGYDAIGASAEIQTSAFSVQSELALLLLDDTNQSRFTVIDGLIDETTSSLDRLGDNADSDREAAAAETLAIRWQRYQDVVNEIRQLSDSGDPDSAAAVFQSDGLATFNGVNTAIESVLLDNRNQFSDGIEVAASAVDLNPWLCLLLTVASGLLAILAVQRRLGDYR
ncbi:MAG: hypothetical protein OER95_18680, partial [Acidimicrobiia bacterium]|nr:hypothetical protein [Acidimicrobiia bacterium]